jgi:chromosome segregation ATPase
LLKNQLSNKDEDVRDIADAKAKYRDFYEDKLGIEIEATERAKAKLEDANQRLQELEDDCENLRQDY